MMIHYGNLNASFLKEKPPGRKLINTTVSNIQRLPELEHAIKRHIKKNGLIYWVCPLVDEGQNTELSHVTGRAEQLAQQFGEHNVALIHGKIKGTERQNIIKNFSSAKTPILVASTVIEVGIDVPAADVMIIEHAERFGLSQLHQLRGRVGRGQNDAFCILLYAPPLSHVAQQRLNIIRQSQDGFFIAEKDLELRGAGDVLGTRQSGDLQFHFINTHEHRKILDLVSHDIKQYQISPQNHEHIPHLLSLFQYDKTLNLTKSG
jgi:ATP-dependent DNA helicase RecG